MRLELSGRIFISMASRYKSEKEILYIVASFENASIVRANLTHAEHFVVALYYLDRDSFDTALNRMRAGLMNLLINGFKVDLEKEMPYHETLTVFWMRTVDDFNRGESRTGANSTARLIHEKANALIDRFDKKHPLAFYTSERLFSDEARAKYIEPDLKLSQIANS